MLNRKQARGKRIMSAVVTIAIVLSSTLVAVARSQADTQPAAQSQVSVDAAGFSCGLVVGYRVHCWGPNLYDEVTSVPSDAAKAVDVGGLHGCLITIADRIKCWGSNPHNELAMPTDLGTVLSVDTWSVDTCVVTTEHMVRCWGYNDVGQSDVPANLGQVDSVVAGRWVSCAITAAGEVRCWGRADLRGVPLGAQSAESLSAGEDNVCVIKPERLGAICWGNNASVNSVPSFGGEILQLKVGATNACALLRSGLVQCWGSDSKINAVPSDSGLEFSAISVGDRHACGVISGGSIKCWGSNEYKNLDVASEFVLPAPSNVRVQGAHSQLKVSWDSVQSPNANSVVTYRVWAGSNTLSCTTSELSCEITGLIDGQDYSVSVSASDGTVSSSPSDVVSAMPGVAPSSPTDIAVVAGGGQAQVSWTAPTAGSPLTNLRYSVTSSPGGLTCTTSSTSCMVSGLTNGRTYTFSVLASTAVGTSDPAVSGSVTPGTTPDQVSGLSNVARSSNAVSVGWAAPNSNGSAISSYLVRTSSDGSSWSEPVDTASTATSHLLSGMSSATARLVQVSAKNSKGQGPWSDSFLTTSKGAKLVRVTVQDSTGQPVTGGAITWRMTDNSAWSAKTYGLTADGIIDFPYAPAGAVNVTLTNGQMADGSIASGSWSSVLGFASTILTVPSTNAYAARTVHVQLPNGYPVANVKVTVSGSGQTSTRQAQGFTFTQPVSTKTGFTDTAGNFTVTGYWTGVPSANTLYNDGIIVQQQDNSLVSSTTTVELDYMPWVSFDTSQVTGDAGAPQVVQVSAVDSDVSNLRGRHYVTAPPVKAGVAVTLVPPKGVKVAKCANGKTQKLTGTTGSNGKAKLTICAYKSGIYTLKTAGAASVGSIRVLVKGAAPLAPTSVNVKSTVVGQMRASWNKPLYDGGSAITQYTITARAKGKPTVTKVIKATVSKKGVITKPPATLQTLTGLSNATLYTVTIAATTKNGTSDAYVVSVPVA